MKEAFYEDLRNTIAVELRSVKLIIILGDLTPESAGTVIMVSASATAMAFFCSRRVLLMTWSSSGRWTDRT
jgi:hypothetical protein